MQRSYRFEVANYDYMYFSLETCLASKGLSSLYECIVKFIVPIEDNIYVKHPLRKHQAYCKEYDDAILPHAV